MMIPSTVDCIIIGTGLTNSIIAAACARIGKSVLHVDRNNYYGADWASFTFQQLIDWIKDNNPDNECLQEIPDELIKKSRMFCIDLCPRLLYSNGSMVDTLVKSNVSRYHEFKNNIRILSMIDDDIHVMPCRRSDVFTSPLLTNLIDKRRLMKFIELCVKSNTNDNSIETNEVLEHSDMPIEEFLQAQGLNSILRNYIINSIAMVDKGTSTKEACENIKRFMMATERYGRSPFLFPLYGCGEFPQSFCRLSAVFGGVYCLNTKLEEVDIQSSKKFNVKLSNGNVESDMLVMDYKSALDINFAQAPKLYFKSTRAILITSQSIVEDSDNLISFLRTRDKADIPVYLLELNSSVMVCPTNVHLVYLWTSGSGDLVQTIERVFDEKTIIWKFIYSYSTGLEDFNTDIENLYFTNIPNDDLDYTNSIKQAEVIFKRMCPNEEFLPRAPDPEEIIGPW